jgi:hypothetical protein
MLVMTITMFIITHQIYFSSKAEREEILTEACYLVETDGILSSAEMCIEVLSLASQVAPRQPSQLVVCPVM